jgi:indole-3-glycerol phosphate synthase
MRTPGEKIKLIAEIKKASPSKGIVRRDFDHLSIARIYEEKAVNAVSVLTEEDFFQGSLAFLPEVKNVLTKPVLRKDFIFDEYQIYESRAYEADAILLIASILDRNQAVEYLHLAGELGLSVLFEVHDFKELETALVTGSDIIGINNRDLKTLKIDINTTFNLKKEISPNKIVVSESGIKTREDVKKLEDSGIDAMLIGTSFMEAEDIGKKIDGLMDKSDKM